MINDPELLWRIRELVSSGDALLRVSEEAEKLGVIFPEASKLEICELIIKEAGVEQVGMELGDLDDSTRIMVKRSRAERIRRRAYEIWEHEGRPEGRALAHWEQARREIESA